MYNMPLLAPSPKKRRSHKEDFSGHTGQTLFLEMFIMEGDYFTKLKKLAFPWDDMRIPQLFPGQNKTEFLKKTGSQPTKLFVRTFAQTRCLVHGIFSLVEEGSANRPYVIFPLSLWAEKMASTTLLAELVAWEIGLPNFPRRVGCSRFQGGSEQGICYLTFVSCKIPHISRSI